MNGRRLMLIGGAGLFAIYSIAALVIGARYASWENEERDRILLVKRLTQQPHPGSGLPPLREACRGKLQPGGMHALIGYTLPVSESDEEIGDRIVGIVEYVGYSGSTFDAMESWVKYPGPERTILGEWLAALDPMGWSYKTKRQGAGGSPEVRDARYVAITQVHELVMPSEEVDEYIPGVARLETRVLSLPEGAPICAGQSWATRTGTIEATGRGRDESEAQSAADSSLSFHVKAYFINAIQYGPMVILCEAGGTAFCEQMRQEAPHVL